MVELTWEGKYDQNGRKTAPVRLPLPFQDVETVNESASERVRQMGMFARATGEQPGDWRNRLIWGDKKYVLPSLLPEFAGKVNLIYIDPPFATGADFSFTAQIPDDPTTEGDQSASFVKQPSMIEQKAYRDTWGRGLDGYLQWFYETVVLLHELLAEDGSIYVHLDYHVSHGAKLVLDEVFGSGNLVNEVVWSRSAPRSNVKIGMPVGHDSLLIYARSEKLTWQRPMEALRKEYVKSHYNQVEPETGRFYMLDNMVNPNPDRPNLTYEWHGVTRVWKVTRENMQRLHDEGRLAYTRQGVARYKRYLDESNGTPLTTVWQDIPPVNSQAAERVDYRTQKPEALLERIIKASSNEGDLVLDCFCGSGTTAAVAEKLNRRWIAADLGRFAIHTTRKRLLSIPDVRPFVVQNLGKYERQAWQAAEFGQSHQRAVEAQSRYRRFILDLYGAEELSGYVWLHGLKAGHFVHVGSVDAPVVESDVRAIAREFWQAAGKGGGGGATSAQVDILGWDFAFELNEMGKQMAAEANIPLTFKKIPREVLEKKAVEQGDIRFFELAALDVAAGWLHRPPRTLRIKLQDFVVPHDDIPDQVRRAITHWSQLIDYWAIDWDFKEDTFHNQWQSYRSKKQPQLDLAAEHGYDAPGSYTVLVKVIDILGNDTTKSINVEAE